jgi:hypothetical protein
MDQRAYDVEEDLKDILKTRLALADKLDALERRVQATVESTKMAAFDALDLARNKAAGFIESTSHHLNPSVQAGRRPWVMVGSAIAIGLFAGLIERRRRASRVYRYYPPHAEGADVMPEDGRSRESSGVYPFYGREESRPRTSPFHFDDRPERSISERAQTAIPEILKPLRSMWDDLRMEIAKERDRLQHTVLHTGRSFIQDLVRIAGQSLLDQLSRPGGTGHSRGPRRTRYE